MPKITVCPLGGLANRLRSLASGVWLARRLGVRLDVVWSRDRDLKADFHELFSWRDESVTFRHPSAFGKWFLFMPPRRRNLYLSALGQRLCYGFSLCDGPDIWSFLDNPEMVAEQAALSLERGKDACIVSCNEFFDFPDQLLREIMQPVEGVDKIVEDTLGMLGGNAVGVHIRRTDHAVSISRSPTGRFISSMHGILDENPDTMFFLATDGEQDKRLIVDTFPGHVVCSDKPVSRQTLEGMTEAAADMITLSRCRRILASHGSSFSAIAARLGGIELNYP